MEQSRELLLTAALFLLNMAGFPGGHYYAKLLEALILNGLISLNGRCALMCAREYFHKKFLHVVSAQADDVMVLGGWMVGQQIVSQQHPVGWAGQRRARQPVLIRAHNEHSVLRRTQGRHISLSSILLVIGTSIKISGGKNLINSQSGRQHLS